MIRWLLLILPILASQSAGAAAEQVPGLRVMDYAYNRNQANIDGLDSFVWKTLERALERTRDRYGDYRLSVVPSMPTHRRAYALERGLGGVTVAWLSDNPDREKSLVPVRIPVDRGLGGYRVLLIDAAAQKRFSAVAKAEDLGAFRFGLLPWWDDAVVMRRAGLTVVDGETYEGLFQMLAAHRFDAFSRNAREVIPEYGRLKEQAPGLVIEKHLLLHYLLPAYFWFRDDEEGRRRAERVRAGLEQMVADGTLRKMFDAEFGASLAKLDLQHRLLIELPNPLFDAKLLPADPELWYHP